MEELLSNLTRHAMNYAIRSGITITSGYAISQCSRLLRTVEGGQEHDELETLQLRLESKIRIISPAINMIELIAARGNTSLDSAVALTRSIRMSMQALGVRLSRAVDDSSDGNSKRSKAQELTEIKKILVDIRRLLAQIEDAVPLINLAITTSGVNMSTALPSTVSPSRLLQASTFLSAGDSAYNVNPATPAQIGPVFTLSLYMLFGAHAFRANAKNAHTMTWKEVIHKASVKIMRVPLDSLYDLHDAERQKSLALAHSQTPRHQVPARSQSAEYSSQLVMIEDLDDDRVHSFDEAGDIGRFENVALAGIRKFLPIHEISKIFYADTGKILNLGSDGESNSPVLLVKRDQAAIPPRRMMDDSSAEDSYADIIGSENEDEDEDESVAQIYREFSTGSSKIDREPVNKKAWAFPPDLDPEWLAFEVYTEEHDSTDEDDEREEYEQNHGNIDQCSPGKDPVRPITESMSDMDIHDSPIRTTRADQSYDIKSRQAFPMFKRTGPASIPALRTSLSLLELLIRLTALQQFQQTTHLAIEDELLNFFLSESSSTGAGADSERRKVMRATARRQVGFDPYAESPIRLRGEGYTNTHENIDHSKDHNSTSNMDASPASGLSEARRHGDRSPPLHQPQIGLTGKSEVKTDLGRGSSAPVTPLGMTKDRTRNLRDTQVSRSSPLRKSET